MKRLSILVALLVLEISVFTALSGNRFETTQSLFVYLKSYLADLVAQSAPTLLLAFGMTIVLSTAGIDLSIGSMVALVSCVISSFPSGDAFWWTAVPAGLATALAAGVLNGLLIARLDVPPIIATLGTMIFYRGLCFVLMGDLEKSPFLDVPGYELLGQFRGAAILTLLVFLLGGIYYTHSVWRREILMMGGNRIAARYAGIRVEKRTFQVYLLVGFLSFLAALAFTARNGSVSASSLSGLELHVIVAVVLGGTKVQGGSGTILGTIFGVLFIAVLDEGLRGAAIWGGRHLPFRISHLEYVLLGLLLVLGVTFNNYLLTRTQNWVKTDHG
ncbi:MAG TPA: ABC transporter permease [Verrucomicrobiae bacterium]|nr:ABC transporter permease [Verrucomicrobiae bacterium]